MDVVDLDGPRTGDGAAVDQGADHAAGDADRCPLHDRGGGTADQAAVVQQAEVAVIDERAAGDELTNAQAGAAAGDRAAVLQRIDGAADQVDRREGDGVAGGRGAAGVDDQAAVQQRAEVADIGDGGRRYRHDEGTRLIARALVGDGAGTGVVEDVHVAGQVEAGAGGGVPDQAGIGDGTDGDAQEVHPGRGGHGLDGAGGAIDQRPDLGAAIGINTTGGGCRPLDRAIILDGADGAAGGQGDAAAAADPALHQAAVDDQAHGAHAAGSGVATDRQPGRPAQRAGIGQGAQAAGRGDVDRRLAGADVQSAGVVQAGGGGAEVIIVQVIEQRGTADRGGGPGADAVFVDDGGSQAQARDDGVGDHQGVEAGELATHQQGMDTARRIVAGGVVVAVDDGTARRDNPAGDRDVGAVVQDQPVAAQGLDRLGEVAGDGDVVVNGDRAAVEQHGAGGDVEVIVQQQVAVDAVHAAANGDVGARAGDGALLTAAQATGGARQRADRAQRTARDGQREGGAVDDVAGHQAAVEQRRRRGAAGDGDGRNAADGTAVHQCPAIAGGQHQAGATGPGGDGPGVGGACGLRRCGPGGGKRHAHSQGGRPEKESLPQLAALTVHLLHQLRHAIPLPTAGLTRAGIGRTKRRLGDRRARPPLAPKSAYTPDQSRLGPQNSITALNPIGQAAIPFCIGSKLLSISTCVKAAILSEDRRRDPRTQIIKATIIGCHISSQLMIIPSELMIYDGLLANPG
ncbi:PE-PGRS family protein [Nitrospirillum viridazoti Y2]|nr:PE-PGRS family protein [Nitrospirillum amazonense Y2]